MENILFDQDPIADTQGCVSAIFSLYIQPSSAVAYFQPVSSIDTYKTENLEPLGVKLSSLYSEVIPST